MSGEEKVALLTRKLRETRDALERAQRANRLYARENERLWNRFYEMERAAQRLGRRTRKPTQRRITG